MWTRNEHEDEGKAKWLEAWLWWHEYIKDNAASLIKRPPKTEPVDCSERSRSVDIVGFAGHSVSVTSTHQALSGKSSCRQHIKECVTRHQHRFTHRSGFGVDALCRPDFVSLSDKAAVL